METWKSQRRYNLKILQFVIVVGVFYVYVRNVLDISIRREVEVRHELLNANINLSVSVCVPIVVEHAVYTSRLYFQPSLYLERSLQTVGYPCNVTLNRTTYDLFEWFAHCGRLRSLMVSRLSRIGSTGDFVSSPADSQIESLPFQIYINFNHYCIVWDKLLDLDPASRVVFKYHNQIRLSQLKFYVHQMCTFPEYPNQYSILENTEQFGNRVQVRVQQLEITDRTSTDEPTNGGQLTTGHTSPTINIGCIQSFSVNPFASSHRCHKRSEIAFSPEHCLQHCCKSVGVHLSNFLYVSPFKNYTLLSPSSIDLCRPHCAAQCVRRRCQQSLYIQGSHHEHDVTHNLKQESNVVDETLEIELTLEPVGLRLSKRKTVPTTFYVSHLANLITIVFGFNVRSTLHLLQLVLHVHTDRGWMRQWYRIGLWLVTATCVAFAFVQTIYLLHQYLQRNVQSTFIVKLRRPLLKFSLSFCFHMCKLLQDDCAFQYNIISDSNNRFTPLNLTTIESQTESFEQLFLQIMINDRELIEHFNRTHFIFFFQSYKCVRLDFDVVDILRNKNILQTQCPFLNKFFPLHLFVYLQIASVGYLLSDYQTYPHMDAIMMNSESQPIRYERHDLPPPYAGSFCHSYQQDRRFSYTTRLTSIERCIQEQYFNLTGRLHLLLPQPRHELNRTLFDLSSSNELSIVMQHCKRLHAQRDCDQVEYVDQFYIRGFSRSTASVPFLQFPLLVHEHLYGEAPLINYIDLIICLVGVSSVWFGFGAYTLLVHIVPSLVAGCRRWKQLPQQIGRIVQSKVLPTLLLLLCVYNVYHLIGTYVFGDAKVISYIAISKTVFPPIVSLCTTIQHPKWSSGFPLMTFRQQMLSLDSIENLTYLANIQLPLHQIVEWIRFESPNGEIRLESRKALDKLQFKELTYNLKVMPYFHLTDFCYAFHLNYQLRFTRQVRMAIKLLSFVVKGQHVKVHVHSFDSLHRDFQKLELNSILLRVNFYNYFRAWQQPIGNVFNCLRNQYGGFQLDRALEQSILSDWASNYTSTYLPVTKLHFNRTLNNRMFWTRLQQVGQLKQFRSLATYQCDMFHQLRAKRLKSMRNQQEKFQLCAGLIDTFMLYQFKISLSELLLYVSSVMSFWLDFCLLRFINRLIDSINHVCTGLINWSRSAGRTDRRLSYDQAGSQVCMNPIHSNPHCIANRSISINSIQFNQRLNRPANRRRSHRVKSITSHSVFVTGLTPRRSSYASTERNKVHPIMNSIAFEFRS